MSLIRLTVSEKMALTDGRAKYDGRPNHDIALLCSITEQS